MEKAKYILAMIGGALITYFGQYLLLYALVGVAVLMDLISGMAAAVIEGQGLSSKTARAGFVKKLMLLFAVGFGTFLDVLLPWCAELVGMEIQSTLLFGTVICVYICIGESISIMENIYRSTGKRLPKWIAKLLQITKEKLEENNNI